MDNLCIVPADALEPVPLSVGESGRLFRWNGRLLRGVQTHHVDAFRRLFDCGLVAALVERGLLVRSWITDLRVHGFDLVIEHEPIDAPSYPREWTFGMARDAALLVLAVNEVAAGFGFQTRDCHGYNILFRGGRPVYVDLGSFVPAQRGNDRLLSYHEFMRAHFYPLRLWRIGGQFLGTRMATRVGSILPAASYWKCATPFARFFSDSTIERAVGRMHALRTISHRELPELLTRHRGWRATLVRRLHALDPLGRGASFAALRRRVARAKPPRGRTSWSDYQESMAVGDASPLTPRFEAIIARLQALEVGSVLEIAGNQGVLSRRLASDGRLRVICTDADALALDRGYLAASRNGATLDWAILDPCRHESSPQELPPSQRFRCDAVVALALTHHLLLTQGLSLGSVLESLGRFAERFLLIEFMPKGLWDGRQGVPTPPWYTESWFRDEFERRFELVERTQLEQNRILFVGRVMKGRGDETHAAEHAAERATERAAERAAEHAAASDRRGSRP